MRETSEPSEIIALLRRTEPHMVGIDGLDGSGKSSLASLLSSELGRPHINLDDYLEKNLGQYVKHIRYDELSNKLSNTRAPLIIEGVCLLSVLERLQGNLGFLIYVKRMASYGSWRDEDDCVVTGDIGEFMKRKKEELQRFVELEARIKGTEPPNEVVFPQLAEEIIRYHYEYRPHEKADIIYNRID